MIPLRDRNPTRSLAWLTLVLVGVNIAVYVLVQPHSGRSVVSLPDPRQTVEFPMALADLRFNLAYAAVPCEIVEGRPLQAREVVATFRDGDQSACNEGPEGGRFPVFPGKSPWLALLTSMFLHGGVLHLAGNMLFLWVFGNNIEDRWGRIRYLIFYLAGGLVASLAHVAADPNSTVPIVGASGAIAAVMGAYLVLYPKARITTAFVIFILFVRDISAGWLLAFWFLSQFFLTSGSGVAWMAHVGGFVFGAAVALVVKLLSKSDADRALERESLPSRFT